MAGYYDVCERCGAFIWGFRDCDCLKTSPSTSNQHKETTMTQAATRTITSATIRVARDSMGDMNADAYLERLEAAIRNLPDLGEDAEITVALDDVTRYEGLYSDSPAYRYDDLSERLNTLAEDVYAAMCRGE